MARSHITWFLTALALVGCGNIYANPYPPIPPQPPGPSQQEIDAKVADILNRAKAVQAAADAAVKLEGSDQAARMHQEVRACRRGRDGCTTFESQAEKLSKVGAQAGFADWLVDGFAGLTPDAFRTRFFADVFSGGTPVVRGDGVVLGRSPPQIEPALAQAEDLVKQATAAAQVVADARGADQAEKDACMQAANDCDAQGDAYCEGKCNGGDWKYCEVWALHLWKRTPPDFVNARATMSRSCNAGVHIACKLMPQIDADEQGVAAKTNAMWADVQAIGDRLASNRYTLAMVLKLRPTARNQRDVETARNMEPGIIAQQYCPARAAFIQRTSLAEFRQRVATHCRNDPPTAQGPSGTPVPLPTECTTIFATRCP